MGDGGGGSGLGEGGGGGLGEGGGGGGRAHTRRSSPNCLGRGRYISPSGNTRDACHHRGCGGN